MNGLGIRWKDIIGGFGVPGKIENGRRVPSMGSQTNYKNKYVKWSTCSEFKPTNGKQCERCSKNWKEWERLGRYTYNKKVMVNSREH